MWSYPVPAVPVPSGSDLQELPWRTATRWASSSALNTTTAQGSQAPATPAVPSPSAQGSPTGSSSGAVASSAKQEEKSANSMHLLEYFVAGGIAGAASRTVVAPVERLKIIFQVQGPGSANYQGILPSLIKIGKEEGWKGYFRGNYANCIRIIPYSAVQFTSYEMAKRVLSQFSPEGPGGPLNTPLRLLAGATAGICSVVSTYPLDLVRSRLSIISATIGSRKATLQGKELGMIGMTLKVYREEGGLRALYRGLIPTAVGVAPCDVGLNFAAFEFLKQYFMPPGGQPSTVRKLGCGALAGAISQSCTYPLDVLRRRMQVVGMKDSGFQYRGAWHAIFVITKSEGIRGLYKGMWPNLLKVAPSIGTSFVTYEFVRDGLLSLEA